MSWIGGDAASCLAAVIGIVCSGIAVAEVATWSAVDSARPCSGNVIVGSCDDPVRVVRVYCDGRLVLGGCKCVLVDGYVWGFDSGAVEGAIEDVSWRDGRVG